jgi:choline dehydrogenase-like flavoprotein
MPTSCRLRRGRVAALQNASYAPHDVACFTAHQMGSCRMGVDPATSVADGRGELHDTKGVWIGDGCAFPSAPGVNPMVSIMSLARRTAAAIVG